MLGLRRAGVCVSEVWVGGVASRRGGKPGSGTGSGAIFTEGLYCEAVIREAAGRVGVPKQRLCVSSGVSTYIPLKMPKGI